MASSKYAGLGVRTNARVSIWSVERSVTDVLRAIVNVLDNNLAMIRLTLGSSEVLELMCNSNLRVCGILLQHRQPELVRMSSLAFFFIDIRQYLLCVGPKVQSDTVWFRWC